MTRKAHLVLMLRRLQQQNDEQRRMIEAIEAELQAENDTVPTRADVDAKIDRLLRKKGQIK